MRASLRHRCTEKPRAAKASGACANRAAPRRAATRTSSCPELLLRTGRALAARRPARERAGARLRGVACVSGAG